MTYKDTDLYSILDYLNISYQITQHKPLFTVTESQHLRGELQGAHVKNLFLRDKKKTHYWLITLLEDRQIDLKKLRHVINAPSNLSFGPEDKLYELLGVKPGAVTIFGLMNDYNNIIIPYLDKGIFDYHLFNAHPLRNDRTTTIATHDIEKFINHYDYKLQLLDYDMIKRH